MSVEIKSVNQLLGQMIRKVKAETAVTDVNVGSAFLSLLEAAASNDYENNTAILNVLELLNIDAVKNNDLDARAADYGLSRKAALRSSGLVTIKNTSITKRSTGLYVIKPAPIAGQTTLYVNSTVGWSATGSLFIGRGTESFEGPINYTAITVYPTYSAITLASALQKDHLISDVVIDSQAQPDVVINSGTTVKIPANNLNPEVLYTTLRDAILAAGEDTVTGVEVLAQVSGSIGNAPINTITQFDSLPFAGATVSNTSSFSNGRDIETDAELRNRIKSYAITLARGTSPAILASVIGISDPDDSKQVASAVLTEPVKVGDPSILYVDDGSGFQPSYAGQSVDKLLNSASGTEEFMQLANYPLPRPQVINVVGGPFVIIDGSFLRVEVDGKEETVYFTSANFVNSSAASIAELMVSLNDQATLFKARFDENSTRMLLYPTAHDAETIRVSPLRTTDDSSLYVNTILKFPTNEFSYISLYQNSTRLREKQKGAEIETVAFASWNITGTGNIIIAVDSTPTQDRNFVLSDFPGASSFTALTLEQWVTAFNAKFAGLNAVSTPSQTMVISSNRVGSLSKIEITGGTYLNKWFPNQELTSVGQTAQFQLNRQTGNLRILTDILAGDSISAGVEDAKGFAVSSATVSGNYNVGNDSFGRPAEMVVVADSSFCDGRTVPLIIGSTLTISNPSSNVMRVMASTVDAFASLLPGDFLYVSYRTSSWLSAANTGLFKILKKGKHLTANTDSYVDVSNVGVVVEGPITVIDALDLKAFSTDGYPQIWRGTYVSNPPAEPISGITASLNKDLLGVKASIFKSSSIKMTSNSETGGSIAIPVSIGNASSLFAQTSAAQAGNPPHIANRISDKSMLSLFKRTTPTNTNVWLDRHTYSDLKGSLTSANVPDVFPFSGTYSESIASTGVLTPTNVDFDDTLALTRGNNEGQLRSIKAEVVGDAVGTQQGTARTSLDHVVGDEFLLVKPVQLSSEDSVVVVMDKDSTSKTIDILMSRTGIVNSGSGLLSFSPTTTELSATDYDNEPGIDFSNLTVWGSNINGSDFSDYAVWMRARNWYASGGTGSANGKMLVRSMQYGPNGEKLRFSIKYPSIPDQTNSTFFQNTPSYSTYSYVFGSGSAQPIAISAGDTIAVKGPYPNTATNFPNGSVSSGNYFDYTFSTGNFGPVNIGDVLSIVDGAGISTFNKGQFRVANKNGFTVRVFNPNATVTTPGAAEVTAVTTVADVVGTPTVYTMTTVADVAGSLHQKYFIIYDTAGSVAVWFDVNNVGAAPPPHGASRAIKVATIVTGDTAATVATKVGNAISLDSAYTIGVISNQITITNTVNGALAAATAGTSGFTPATTTGTANVTSDGKYFIIYDDVGSVAVWFDVANNGTLEPFHGADRSIKVTGVTPGDSATNVAAAIVAVVNPDTQFVASNLSNVVTITRAFNGNVPASTVGTTGFSVSDTNGSLPTSELITNPSAINIFPLAQTLVSDIATKVNAGNILRIVAVSGTAIAVATVEDDYSYGGNATALGYGHNPTSSTLRDHISLYDGINYIKAFANANPNFTMKQAFTLQGVSSIYSMNTCANDGSSDIGEFFKLIPITIKNVYHQLTQKALSQLPIVANVSISSDRKNIQITSKKLGSEGSVEVVGGNANKSQSYIFSESEVASDSSGNYLLAKISAFPDTFNTGDIVKLQNDAGVKRLSRLSSTDSITVTNPSSGVVEYNYNPKATVFVSGTTFTIADVSGSYNRPSGTVWRWTHGGGGASLAQVKAGDLLYAFGTLTGWSQGNKSIPGGDGIISGLPIIYVNDVSNYVDVVNPHGKAMSSTAVGLSSTVQICPTPIIKWQLKHAAKVAISSMTRVSSLVTVNCAGNHFLNTGDSVDVGDSDNIADGTYTSITTTGSNSFTFILAGTDFTEGASGASIIKTGLVPTRYRLQKLGLNNMVRLSRNDGESPRFADCGVAVDDYVVLGGSTFKANNNGRFRVAAVDNDSMMLINSEASDELNTVRSFNNKALYPTWTANTNTITGVAGTFKNLELGDWVKKPEDPDTSYRQVTAFSPGTAASATQITVGSNYPGVSASAPGVFYDQLNDYEAGVELLNSDDISVYEGDSAVSGDMLFVQNIINTNWFSTNNIGSFEITEVGVNPTTFKPFVRIVNASGSAESNRLMSVNTEGFYLIEGMVNRFYSFRQINHAILDDLNQERRSLYMTPSNRNYKFSSANTTSILHMGKFGYNTDVTTGIDGYLYYTGLLRRVQRIVDGYEPDAENFPGRRAVGGLIETLPPLTKSISMSIDVTTNEGVNLGDISNNIKSVIINYVEGLGVGQDVVLSEIIAAIMGIKGVGAATFNNPVPSTERITIDSTSKAVVSPENIGIA